MKVRWLKIISITAIPLFLFVLLLWVRWLNDPKADEMERQARYLSGWRAIDCGHVRTDVDNNSTEELRALECANACTITAFRDRKAFRMRHDVTTMDSTVHYGLIGTPRGEIYALKSESGSGFRPLTRHKWKNPIVIRRDNKERLIEAK
jgi:hypothetical protein